MVAIVDLQGRLQGKRLDARFFLDETLTHGTEGCNYLLAVDVEMNTVGGYRISSWETATATSSWSLTCPPCAGRHGSRVAWMLADVEWLDGRPVPESPRQILQHQLDRLAERGWVAYVGTELEFILFDETYESAWTKRYSGLKPANQYNMDYSILGTSRVEPVLRGYPSGACATPGCRSSRPKGSATSASTRSPSNTATPSPPATTTSSTRPAAKEIAAQHGKP